MKLGKSTKWICLLGIITIAFMIYILNMYTQLMNDDFDYAHSIATGERLHSMKDIIYSQIAHYNKINGRVVAHFIAQTFLLLGKPVFNIINTLAFLTLIVLVNYHAAGSLKKIKIDYLIISFLLIWFCSPGFGQSFLWISGSANYLYCMLIALLFLIPYRKAYYEPLNKNTGKTLVKDGIFTVANALFGYIAGWTHESICAALIFILVSYMICFKHNKRHIAPWMISGILGVVFGTLMIILSPGTAHRLDTVGGLGGISVWIYNFGKVTIRYLQYLLPVNILFIALSTCLIGEKGGRGSIDRKFVWLPGIYLMGTFASMYSLILAPYIPPRAWCVPVVLGALVNGILWYRMDINRIHIKKGIQAAIFISAFSFLASYSAAILDLREVRREVLNRENLIQESKQKGIYDVVAPAITGQGGHNYYQDYDLAYDPGEWPNTSIAKYYQLHTITAAPNSRD